MLIVEIVFLILIDKDFFIVRAGYYYLIFFSESNLRHAFVISLLQYSITNDNVIYNNLDSGCSSGAAQLLAKCQDF